MCRIRTRRFGLRSPLAMIVLLFGGSAALAQLRVATWNVSDYSGGRVADIQTAVYAAFQGRSMAPDIILTQEFLSAAAVTAFKTALNGAAGGPGDWAAAIFVNGPDTDSAFFYRTSKVTLLGVTVVSAGGDSPDPPRNTMRYDLRLVGYASPGATLACYDSHMKSGNTDEDNARRLVEAQRIRADAQALQPDWHFLLGGDLNIPSSAQAAYQELVGDQANNAGRFFDPIVTPGAWQNNPEFTFVHTQDPIGPGGMDDRFDQFLVSQSLIDGDGFDYIGDAAAPYSTSTWDDPNHTYRSWGNDGTSFNTFLTINGNTMVGAAIAQALVNIADGAGHLPVFLDLQVPPEIASDTLIDFGTVEQDAPAQQALHVWNDGNVARWTVAGIADLHYTMTASAGFEAPDGGFADAAGDGVNEHTVSMDTSTLGPQSGTLTLTSNAPDESARVVTLVGLVVSPGASLGDLNCDGALNAFDIDPFVLVITDPPAYQAAYPNCNLYRADCNQDGAVNAFDIDPFVELLTGG